MQDMRYETQLDILRLVQHLMRLYTAAIMSLPLTRALDSARMLVRPSILAATLVWSACGLKLLVYAGCFELLVYVVLIH
jgi:hypothetical protein